MNEFAKEIEQRAQRRVDALAKYGIRASVSFISELSDDAFNILLINVIRHRKLAEDMAEWLLKLPVNDDRQE